MTLEYARLDLLREVKLDGGKAAHTLVVMRPTAKQFADIAVGDTVLERFDQFVSQCCKALNGTGEMLDIHAAQLDGVDGGEIADIIQEMRNAADKITATETGDGINEPLVYTLIHPLTLSDEVKVTQVSFMARRLGEMSEYLDAQTGPDEFPVFMRTFGQLLGTKLPMTDGIANALDFEDYLVIRRVIMGKLVRSRRRWRRT